jgi:ribonuclease III family protein
LNGLTLAYIGDAYYELKIRDHLIRAQKLTIVDHLHKKAIQYTSGTAQAKIIEHLMDTNQLNETEITQVKRGRNQSGPGRKHIDARTYHLATGFESLIGYCYLHDNNRADELIQAAIHFIERG